MSKPLYPKGMAVLCPTCDRDALIVIEDILPLTPIRSMNFQAVPPTTIVQGSPIVSGCCLEPLIGGPHGNRKFLAMRSREGFPK